MSQYKTCRVCRITKPLDNFHKRSINKDGKADRCRFCTNIYGKINYQKNSEKLREVAREYRKNNPEAIAARRLAWKRANPEKNRASVLKWQKNNPDKHSANNKKYCQSNPEKRRAYAQKRRVKKANNGIYIILPKDLRRLYNSPCAYCGSKNNITFDHVIPVARGGHHSIGNAMPLCIPCNSSKGIRTIMEWRLGKIIKL